MNFLRALFFGATLLSSAWSADLAVSTYLRDGFTPSTLAAGPQGDLYLAGSAVVDPATGATAAAVLRVDPAVRRNVYLTFLDSAASDQIAAIAVDSAGNAFVAGTTADSHAFVMKLNPQGAVVFSTPLGGAVSASARGIALTAQGEILVSGVATAKGFPATAGAYSVADTTNQWFLLKLDAAGAKTVFSATGIGGSALAVDAAGNIYMAGSSPGTTYPATPGAYQTSFVQGHYCFGLCQIGFDGGLQHITKVDAAATRLIYSTGLNDPNGRAGSTVNTGLAIDAAGNAYVTGTLLEADYPFTVALPRNANPSGYLSKLDPAGANLLFSVPYGGAGVQLDASGALYAGGTARNPQTSAVPAVAPVLVLPPVFDWVPSECLPNNVTTVSAAYVLKLDPATGAAVDGQWIDGSAPSGAAITLAGGKVWIVGATAAPDVPFSVEAFAPANLGPGNLVGAFLSGVDFSGGRKSGPAIACVLDAGNLTHVGAVSANRLITLFGANLADALVSFNGLPATVLYSSASQINLVTPPPALPSGDNRLAPAVMRLASGAATMYRQFPYANSTPNLFMNAAAADSGCASPAVSPLATNADGAVNSCRNPARPGSTVSLYLHGLGGFDPPFAHAPGVQVSVGNCSAAVVATSLIAGFVYKIDVAVPASLSACTGAPDGASPYLPVSVQYNQQPVGPFSVPANLDGTLRVFAPPGSQPFFYIWVAATTSAP